MVLFCRNLLTLSLALTLLASNPVEGFSSPSPKFQSPTRISDIVMEGIGKSIAQGLLLGCLAIPQMAGAVSGGGLDYANLDITGQDFSNGNYKGKDFTQVCFSMPF